MTIPLGRLSPGASRDRPGRRLGNCLPALRPACRPYLVLLRVGFAMPPLLPGARCALTAPFHPYRQAEAAGGLLSVALSLGSPPPGVTRHPCLRGARTFLDPLRNRGHPAVWQGLPRLRGGGRQPAA